MRILWIIIIFGVNISICNTKQQFLGKFPKGSRVLLFDSTVRSDGDSIQIALIFFCSLYRKLLHFPKYLIIWLPLVELVKSDNILINHVSKKIPIACQNIKLNNDDYYNFYNFFLTRSNTVMKYPKPQSNQAKEGFFLCCR